jgi:hypothetical protein
MYTNDAQTLGQELSRDVSKSTAIQQPMTMEQESVHEGRRRSSVANGSNLSRASSMGLGH